MVKTTSAEAAAAAIAYLDQVKLEFSENQEDYLRFLNLMSAFKQESIDKHDLFQSVSTLFQHRPNLLEGFKTFLPPESLDSEPIKHIKHEDVDYAGADAIVADDSIFPEDLDPSAGDLFPPPEALAALEAHSADAQRSSTKRPYKSKSHDRRELCDATFGPPPTDSLPLGDLPPHLTKLLDPHAGAPYPAPSDFPRPVPRLDRTRVGLKGVEESAPPTVGPVEFHQAVDFIEKVKRRYVDEPRTYASFLKALQRYKHASDPWDKSLQQVHDQVNQLLGDAPDLLREFRRFLPS